MGQYINKAVLVAEIEKLISNGKLKCQQAQKNNDQISYIAWSEHIATCGKILCFLNTIETKKVDLEEEIKSSMNNLCELDCYAQSLLDNPEDYEGFAKPFPKEVNDEIANFAKHFYELGLTQK